MMTQIKAQLGLAVLLALGAWLLRDRGTSGATVVKTLEIDDNILSEHFGDPFPVTGGGSNGSSMINNAVNPEMRRLVDTSNALISQDDAAAAAAGSDNQ